MLWDHVEPSSIVLKPVSQSTSLPASSEPSAWSLSQLCNIAKQADKRTIFFLLSEPDWQMGGHIFQHPSGNAPDVTSGKLCPTQWIGRLESFLSVQWQGKAMNDQIVSAHCRMHVWLYTRNSFYTEKAVRQPFLRPHCRHHIVNGDMPWGGIVIILGMIGFFISI